MPGEPPGPGTGSPDPRVTVVLITHNRRAELARTLDHLARLPERPAVIVVDNGSSDGSAAWVRWQHPGMRLIAARRNLGAVGRNLGLRQVTTPYAAFCDDDTWWEPGSLTLAADTLDAHPDVAAVTARIVVEPSGEDDPIVPELAHSPVPARPGLPGPALLSIMAGASVLRAGPFRAAGGFSPRLWLGGEEELLCTDLVTAGYWLCYLPGATVHHQASAARDATRRRLLGIRNTLWFTWLRRPAGPALRRTAELARTVPRDVTSAAAFWAAARGLPWVLRERRPVTPEVEARIQLLEEPRRRSSARRYVG
ncbi:MAG TPA: glycosyltransferase [Trebonia sp.]